MKNLLFSVRYADTGTTERFVATDAVIAMQKARVLRPEAPIESARFIGEATDECPGCGLPGVMGRGLGVCPSCERQVP